MNQHEAAAGAPEEGQTVFVTGISGYIGGTVAVKLREAGFRITGLVRSDAQESALREAGMKAVRGDLSSLSVLKQAVMDADAVIHTADADDPIVAERFLAQLRGTGKTFIYTSGAAVVANWTRPENAAFVYSEDFPLESRSPFGNRPGIHAAILRSAAAGVRSILMIPSMVYGDGLLLAKESKQIPFLVRSARKLGHAAYVGDGRHRWSSVHVEDLADLYVAALRRARAGSAFFAENGDASFKEIAEIIHQRLGFAGSPISLSRSQAAAEWGETMASVALGSDCRITAEKARLLLGWQPRRGPLQEYILG